jgi:transglutaminase-like putative cysteine protease
MTENNEKEAKTIFAKWNANEKNRIVNVSFKVKLTPRTAPLKECCEKGVEKFLLPSAHIPTDGIIFQTAKNICGNEKDVNKKARKIYDWVAQNTYRDPATKGCGVGNPKMMLLEKKMGGKCFDISSLLVALLRASGIAAREIFGLRIGDSRLHAQFGASGNITGAHHCKVEFYNPKRGWVMTDAGDVTKYRLAEKLLATDPKALAMQQKLFGSGENNWLALNYGRDFALYPQSVQTPLDGFNYPYAELDGQTLDYYDAKTFIYSFYSKEI